MTEMNPADVPQEFIDACDKAIAAAYDASPYGGLGYIEGVRIMLAAALPLYEKQLREQIAAEVEGYRDPEPTDQWDRGYEVALNDALRRIRGDDTTGLDRVQEAVRKARGGDAPPQIRGYA
jgi:hypothetical protein